MTPREQCSQALDCFVTLAKTFAKSSIWLFALNVHAVSIDDALTHQSKLQHGAVSFVNYCSGCHTLRYMRFSRMVYDLHLKPADVHDLTQISMPTIDAKHWFGQMPLDLSLTARARGDKWLYDYLSGFYTDKHQPFGANNTLIPNVTMPHILGPLKIQNQLAYDATLRDLVLFLDYVAEPVQLARYQIGIFVLIFLFLVLIMTYLLMRTRDSLIDV